MNSLAQLLSRRRLPIEDPKTMETINLLTGDETVDISWEDFIQICREEQIHINVLLAIWFLLILKMREHLKMYPDTNSIISVAISITIGAFSTIKSVNLLPDKSFWKNGSDHPSGNYGSPEEYNSFCRFIIAPGNSYAELVSPISFTNYRSQSFAYCLGFCLNQLLVHSYRIWHAGYNKFGIKQSITGTLDFLPVSIRYLIINLTSTNPENGITNLEDRIALSTLENLARSCLCVLSGDIALKGPLSPELGPDGQFRNVLDLCIANKNINDTQLKQYELDKIQLDAETVIKRNFQQNLSDYEQQIQNFRDFQDSKKNIESYTLPTLNSNSADKQILLFSPLMLKYLQMTQSEKDTQSLVVKKRIAENLMSKMIRTILIGGQINMSELQVIKQHHHSPQEIVDRYNQIITIISSKYTYGCIMILSKMLKCFLSSMLKGLGLTSERNLSDHVLYHKLIEYAVDMLVFAIIMLDNAKDIEHTYANNSIHAYNIIKCKIIDRSLKQNVEFELCAVYKLYKFILHHIDLTPDYYSIIEVATRDYIITVMDKAKLILNEKI